MTNPISLDQVMGITLETGDTDAIVNYSSGTGTSTLTFNYVVSAGHTSPDLEYVATNALNQNNSTVVDVGGNSANLTLPSPGATNSLGANKSIIIDTEAPTVTSVTSTINNGTYVVDDVIPITVNFSEIVTVSGTPQITLETGANDAIVNYSDGSGSTALVFEYTVSQGHNSDDLDYVATSSLALNSGSILDRAGNAGVLTLGAPGSETSLAGIKILLLTLHCQLQYQ